MSRMTLALLLAASPAMAMAADPVTAEQALANHRKLFKTPDELDCPRGEGDEIVVCGRRPEQAERDRALLASQGPVRARGEAPSGTSAMGAGGCIQRCHQPLSIDILGTAVKVAQGLKRVLESDR